MQTSAPRRIETSLLVVARFNDSAGTTWEVGDRAPLARRAVRETALLRPELFLVEYETLPLTQDDLTGWLAELVAKYGRYEPPPGDRITARTAAASTQTAPSPNRRPDPDRGRASLHGSLSATGSHRTSSRETENTTKRKHA